MTRDHPAGLPAQGSERRCERRLRCLKGGRVTFNAGFAVLDCRIRDISGGGAQIEIDSVLGVPREFELQFDGTSRRCSTRWRARKRMGVAFVD